MIKMFKRLCKWYSMEFDLYMQYNVEYNHVQSLETEDEKDEYYKNRTYPKWYHWRRITFWTKYIYCITIRDFITRQLCKRFGHKWVDDSYAGPDSGCMSVYCKRCGGSWGKQLY